MFSFGDDLHSITKISATFLHQPLSLAPQFKNDEKPPRIVLNHDFLLPLILEKIETLECVIGMMLPIEVDSDHFKVYFEAENKDEEDKIPIKSWRAAKRKLSNRISFDMAARGLLCDPWPDDDRKATQFYRRGRAAINSRFFVDAFVNYYFFLERLYAAGQFKTAEVKKRFSTSHEIQQAYASIETSIRDDAEKCGAPINGDVEQFCEWMVNRRGFFQHQSQTDPNRWLHSTQEKFAPEAFVAAQFAMAVYNVRYTSMIFDRKLNERWVEAAKKVRAMLEIVVEIFGEDPHGNPVRKRFGVNGPGTRVTYQVAEDTLKAAIKFADEYLISVRQMTATLKSTHELIFSYTGPVIYARAKMQDEDQE